MEDRRYVTLDSNIRIDVRNNDEIAPPSHELLGFNRAVEIAANVTRTSVLELTYGGRMSPQELTDWLVGLGIAPENIDRGPRYLDQGLALNHRLQEILKPSIPFDLNEYISRECKKLGIAGTKLEAMNEIYLADVNLFYIPPSADAPWNRPTPHLDALEESEREELSKLYKRLLKTWRRGKWDPLALYEHITNAVYTPHPEHSIFVTDDQADFIKGDKLEAIRRLGFLGKILSPQDAIDFIKLLLAQETQPFVLPDQ